MASSSLPTERQSFWYETGYKNDYPKLEEDNRTEVAVIGGGIAGVLTAYTLAKSGYRVILLEGRKLLNGTTGYSTAKLSAQHQLIYDELIRRYDEARARLFYHANMEGIEYIKQITKEHQIDCQFEEQKAYVYTQNENEINTFKREADAYKKLGIKGHLHKELPIHIDVKAAIEMEQQAQFHPVTFLHSVLDILKELNVEIYEHSLVVDVKQNEKGEQINLKIENGVKVTCSKAVFATHYPAFDPDKKYTNMDVEMSYALAVKTRKEHPDGMYINEDMPKRTFRKMIVNDVEYMLIGGQSHPVGDQYQEMDLYADLYQLAKNTFGESEVVYRWSSHDLITKDRIPFIGMLQPDYPNIFTLTGFSKWGLASAAAGSKLIADLIAGKHNRYKKVFNPQREIPDLIDKKDETKQSKGNIRELDLSIDPESLQENEATIIKKDDKHIGIYIDEAGKLHFLHISCTHLGCELSWNNGDYTWDCPCHGSRFHATGEILAGPALKSLTEEKE